MSLVFDDKRYEVKECTIDNMKIVYRAFENIKYCTNPRDEIQRMNIFVPEEYYEGKQINGYDINTAPIFMPNTVGGYMPGPADYPGMNKFSNHINATFMALRHGYVVACAGIRGRTTGKDTTEFFEGSKEGKISNATGKKCGRAPALIVDYKAAIRYLRHNKSLVPGDTERIITDGTSAGGALSALAGATGNSSDYESYLEQIGAAKERDDIFAASCYCPIHNLENADMAYEWQFCGENTYHRTKKERQGDSLIRINVDEDMSPKQIEISKQLKASFPSYLSSIGLLDDDGSLLTLDEKGEGSFKEHVKKYLIKSASDEYENHESEQNLSDLMVVGSQIDKQDYIEINEGRVTNIDFEKYVNKITRMKPAPAFDGLDLSTPENEEFGDEIVDYRHFTRFSKDNSEVPDSTIADENIIRMINPICYIKDGDSDVAPNWYIRHGSFDRDTSIAIQVILATLLKNKGYNVNFKLPWGIPHSGDYGMDELFAWIDDLCLRKG